VSSSLERLRQIRCERREIGRAGDEEVSRLH
jgi:hypothetical protein